MKIAVFTSNQPRHLALVKRLASVADEVFAVLECTGTPPDTTRSALMQRYFGYVRAAERQVFGEIDFLPANVRCLNLRIGDASLLPLEIFAPALQANYIVVNGASYLKPPLVDALIEKRAVNLHVGISPYYRGAACNFWALQDGNPELVGCSVQLLTRGLDSGATLCHALPAPGACDPFLLGMKAVEAGQVALCNHIKQGTLFKTASVANDKTKEIRYTRAAEFTDAVAEAYLASMPSKEKIGQLLTANKERRPLINPVYV